jgi:MFS family permease
MYTILFAALGPILPFLNVFGKQLGVSEVVMGSITGVLPILFLLAKPLFGLIVDYFQEQRKTVFMGLLGAMSMCYILLYFIPQPEEPFITDKSTYHLPGIQCDQLDICQSWVSILQHFMFTTSDTVGNSFGVTVIQSVLLCILSIKIIKQMHNGKNVPVLSVCMFHLGHYRMDFDDIWNWDSIFKVVNCYFWFG